ncbi:hypothetical protein ACFRAO_44205 [Streptomyces sp. NPDC056656]|uniref:hypothetical protein n=1 Tax=Streptomyces sp. NPDC056656 TaxID=3345895 RepID=UPI0036B8425C
MTGPATFRFTADLEGDAHDLEGADGRRELAVVAARRTTVTKDTPGRLRPGSVFRQETRLGITSTVKQVVPGKRLAWGGRAQGITAVHVWVNNLKHGSESHA